MPKKTHSNEVNNAGRMTQLPKAQLMKVVNASVKTVMQKSPCCTVYEYNLSSNDEEDIFKCPAINSSVIKG
jgi:hypothetical protein